jgi:ankyrin repeat protein
MSKITDLHDAVKRGALAEIKALLDSDRSLANARSETDVRGTYALHVAAEFGQAPAARLLLDYGADVGLLDSENDAIALCWAGFFGRPEVVAVLLTAGSEPSQRNKHGLTPLGCALGGTQGRWKQFSNASLQDWQRCLDAIRSHGGVE